MLLSLNWLREFVPYKGTAEELGEHLTMLGLELEEIVHPFHEIRELILGRVLTCEDHPDSDHAGRISNQKSKTSRCTLPWNDLFRTGNGAQRRPFRYSCPS